MSLSCSTTLQPCACPCRLGIAPRPRPSARNAVQACATGSTSGGRQQRRQEAAAAPSHPPLLGAAAAAASMVSVAAASAAELQPAAAPVLDSASAAAAAAAAAAPAYTPGPVEVGWEIWAGSIAGVIPFAIASFEFGKRILIQRRCPQCRGSGLVQNSRQRLVKCTECGGMLPWISWRYFIFGTATPGNGGPLMQPRGQTSVLYSVPPPLPPQPEQAGQQGAAPPVDAAAAAEQQQQQQQQDAK